MRYFLILTVLLITACAPPKPMIKEINGRTMGTTYTVKYVADDITNQRISTEELGTKIDATLIEVNDLMSTYLSDSELSRLNRAPANISFSIHPETAYVIQEALRIGYLSQGALDVTVGPLVNLWGFGPSEGPGIPRKRMKVPTQEELNEVDAYVGLDRFELNGNSVVKEHPSVYIDLSTIAKGYGVDRVAEILLDYQINNFLVEIGGEMRLSGTKPESQDWLVAIEKPVTNERAFQRIITIGDRAIASSGDYRNYFEEDGVRYSHIIDPNTGKPIEHNLVSVSVISEKSITADGLATALMVMGLDKGFQMAEREDIAALFIYKEGDEFKELPTTAYDNTVVTVR